MHSFVGPVEEMFRFNLFPVQTLGSPMTIKNPLLLGKATFIMERLLGILRKFKATLARVQKQCVGELKEGRIIAEQQALTEHWCEIHV